MLWISLAHSVAYKHASEFLSSIPGKRIDSPLDQGPSTLTLRVLGCQEGQNVVWLLFLLAHRAAVF
jgi:hypothetical protein